MAAIRTLMVSHLLALGWAGPYYYRSQGDGSNEAYRYQVRGDQAMLGSIKYLEDSGPRVINTQRGSNVTLPCRLRILPRGHRVKWVKLGPSPREDIALIANSHRQRGYGGFAGRAFLPRLDKYDVSLLLADVRLDDVGKYKCEIINGVDDDSAVVELQLDGVVFPYQPNQGRYRFNYYQAVRACKEQDAKLATFQQLFQEWLKGLDWCNAGWLEDGTVHYPVSIPRDPCGGRGIPAGIRSYGPKDKRRDRYDAFCFTSAIKGYVYFRRDPAMYNYVSGSNACRSEGATIAKVGQLYAAWRFSRLHRCDPGWLADGSIRYPIVSPRPQCGGPEPGVRTQGFPSLSQRGYGVYCYKQR
ncbi:hyaluronan and proteoglycan link protein 2-like [Scyliorhinus canicula]|uniref:hyaluronan and proteoglycan link protein 2-like n=1 Tax=Scyliorhinus canicula TaxID=7830 RepID=UPI0018F35AA5|nr:hyaluronan and proteoglycan link protein 2-like [Scyliorhinus canicula]